MTLRLQNQAKEDASPGLASHLNVLCKGVPIFISASAISAYWHFFQYRLSANSFSADISISAFRAISTKYRLKYCVEYGYSLGIYLKSSKSYENIGNIGNHQYRRIGISARP